MSPTWQDVEAAKAAAAADNLELKGRAQTLPPGYFAGFYMLLENGIVTVGVGLCDVNGIFVRRYEDYLLATEDWNCHKVASFSYYIYIDKEANYQIEAIAPEFNNLLFGKYHPVNLYRYIGKFTTDASNVITQVYNGDAVGPEGIEEDAVTDDALDPSVASDIADGVQALTDAANAQSTADGKIVTFYADDAPTAEGTGDLWIDTNDGNKLYRWSGAAWTEVQDDDIAQAISDAATAQTTADGKIVTFYQDGIPTATDVGDLWVDTNDKNKLYRAAAIGADEITPGEWEVARDTDVAQAITDAATAQATADGKIVTFYQAGIPTSLDIGDLWVDTDDGNKLYRAESIGADEITGGEWVEIQDTDIAQAISDAGDAQSTADGKIVTFYADEPPTAEGTGDIWIDTNDYNKPYRWSGGAWVSIRDLVVLTFDRIAATVLQAQFSDIAIALTIGYEGTGTIGSPNEGDRRIYIDGDEIGFEVYTKGAWST